MKEEQDVIALDRTVMSPQDTGNPVLDSLVNLLACKGWAIEQIPKVHAVLLEAAIKEPGGLASRNGREDRRQ